MSNTVNTMIMESYFEHAIVNFGFSDDMAEDYAKMRFEKNIK